jgi:PAS domain S-box-containing protein
MTVSLISIFLQLAAAILVLRLVAVTGRWRAWLLIAAAIILMAVYRSVNLYQSAADDIPASPLAPGDLVELAFSVLLVVGVSFIGPIFRKIQDSQNRFDETNQQYQALIEDQTEMIGRHSPDGTRTFVNDSYCKFHGKTREQLVGKSAYDGMTPDDLKRLKDIYKSLTPENPSSDYEISMTAPDGKVIWQLWTKRAFFDSSGQVTEYLSVGHDITERKQTETLNARLGRIIDGSLNEIYVFDAEDYHFLQVNRGAQINLGYSMDELRGMKGLDFGPEGMTLEMFAQLIEPLRSGKEEKIIFESVHRRKDGSEYDVEIQLQLTHSETPPVFIAIVQDITERKQAETLNARLGRIMDGSLNEIYVFDAQTNYFTQVNRGAQVNLGYSMAEMRKLTPVDIKPEVTSEQFEEILKPLRSEEKEIINFETVHQRKDGSAYNVEIQLQLIGSETPPVFVAIVYDITDRKQTEKELNTSNARFRDLAELSADWFWETDENNEYTYFSHDFHPSTGLPAKSYIGKNRIEICREDSYDLAWKDHLKALEERQPFRNFNYEFVTDDGKTHYSSLSGKPIFDEDGQFRGYRGSGTDISLQKTLEKKLDQSQKMEAIGQLTGGIAHDFNNLLGVVQGNAELLQEQIISNPEINANLIDAVLRATKRGADLTRNMLAFSRTLELRPQTIYLNEQIPNLISILQRTIGEDITIDVKSDDNIWPCTVDPGQVENALLNLAINARDAMPDGGTLTVETRNVYLDDNYVNTQTDVNPGDYVMLAVSDTGTGIDEEDLQHVFEPFFTTKEVGKGTGLGLSMVYGFVKQSGGHISINSQDNQGTTVKIYLPRSETVMTGQKSQEIVDQKSGNESILVVEDDPDLRTLAVALLSSMGYQIREAEDGPSALDNMEKQGPVDLLLTDVVLPGGMNGVELAKKITNLHPEINTLFMSGYTEDAFADNDLLGEDAVLLQKPFLKADLASKIRQALDMTG